MAIPRSGGGGTAATAKPADGLGGTPITPAKFQSAFAKSSGAKDNFVTLESFRSHLGGTRADQDAAIRAMRISGKYTLDTHEGLHGQTTPGMRAAAIHGRDTENPQGFIYISKR